MAVTFILNNPNEPMIRQKMFLSEIVQHHKPITENFYTCQTVYIYTAPNIGVHSTSEGVWWGVKKTSF